MRRRFLLTCVIAALALPGCVRPRTGEPRTNVPTALRGQSGPFAPASLRVHPLTHLERDADDRVLLVVHVQLRDRWSDICKGVGFIQFQLHQPTGPGGAGQWENLLKWEVDLYDLERNSVHFDPATQTYRFSLVDLPPWVQQMVPGGDRSATGPGEFLISVRLTTPTPEGSETVLADELVVER